jgi:hypothetical protein
MCVMYVWMYTFIHMYTYMYIMGTIFIYTCMYIRMHVCLSVCLYVYFHSYVHVHVYHRTIFMTIIKARRCAINILPLCAAAEACMHHISLTVTCISQGNTHDNNQGKEVLLIDEDELVPKRQDIPIIYMHVYM